MVVTVRVLFCCDASSQGNCCPCLLLQQSVNPPLLIRLVERRLYLVGTSFLIVTVRVVLMCRCAITCPVILKKHNPCEINTMGPVESLSQYCRDGTSACVRVTDRCDGAVTTLSFQEHIASVRCPASPL